MNHISQLILVTGILVILSGCQNQESEAVDICFKQAPQIEAAQNINIKGTVRRGFNTGQIGQNHFMVEVNYQVATIDNPIPDAKDVWSIKTITCEVKDGIIADGAILGSKSDQVIRKIKKQ
ncbi:MAG: hypothetical protein K8H87_04195 [Pseudorhodoplanes sp.]|nr:hypothetical protein [Pseudorhodoplanes sp.]